MRIFAIPSLILSQEIYQRLPHSRSKVTIPWMVNEWLISGRDGYTGHSWFSELTSHNSLCLPRTHSSLLVIYTLLETQETSFIVKSDLTLSTTKATVNSGFKELRLRKGIQLNSYLSPADSLQISQGIRETLRYRDTGHQNNCTTGINDSSGSWGHASGSQRVPPLPQGLWL